MYPTLHFSCFVKQKEKKHSSVTTLHFTAKYFSSVSLSALTHCYRQASVFSHACGMAPWMAMPVCQPVDPPLWLDLKYLNNYYMDFDEFLCKHSWSQEDETLSIVSMLSCL